MEFIKIIKNNQPPYYELKIYNNLTCKIDLNSLDKISNVYIPGVCIKFTPTWYLNNGYIMCSIPESKNISESHTIYMHRYLMNQFEYDGKLSVDHINRDKTDNRLSNLRIATQSDQNHNRTLKERNYIKPDGFDVEFQLPEYIEYQAESKIKTTKDDKEIESTLPAHFRIHSKYIGFDKHSTKSNKLTIKERLSNALSKRYNLVINNSTKNIKDLYIDGYQFNSNQEFEKHTIECINVLCGFNIDKIPSDDDFLEDSRIKKSNIPTYVYYTPPKNSRGSQLTYDKNNKETKERTQFSSSGSKFKSLDDKFDEIISLMHKNKVEFIWNEKPSFIDDKNQVSDIKSNSEYSLEWLNEIKSSRIEKKQRDKHNPVDIIIIKKLNTDFNNKINKTVTSDIIQLTTDRITLIINDKISNNNIDIGKVADDYTNHTNSDFIDEYNKIKKEIEEESEKRKESQINNLLNRKPIGENNPVKVPEVKPLIIKKNGWKIDVLTIILMVQDKGTLTFNEIAKKYKDIDGNSISLSDVQNICSPGRSYWLDKEDFEEDFPMTYQEYKDKRASNVRIMMANQANSNIKDKVGDEKYLEICKTNSISKRTCDSQTMVDIFLDKYTSLTAAKSSLKHTNKNGEQVTVAMVTQIWNGGTTLFESDFEERTDISYSKYLVDVKEDKTTFTKDLENKEKYEQVLSDVENKKIKELTRTHIKYLKMFGKDDKFIIDLRAKIKAQ
jgi:hypothetical protein